MNMYGSTYPELIASAAAERIKRMERARIAGEARKVRRACRAQRVQQSLVGWTRLSRRTTAETGRPSSRCAH